MKPSFLNLQEIKFIEVHVEIDKNVRSDANDFDFEGSLIGWDIKHAKLKSSSNDWLISLRVANSNDGEDINKCPYLFRIHAISKISIEEHIEEDKKEKLIFESGCALTYGAIRELVTNITSRSIHGTLMLPTPSFKDSFEEHIENNKNQPSTKKPRKKKSSAQE